MSTDAFHRQVKTWLCFKTKLTISEVCTTAHCTHLHSLCILTYFFIFYRQIHQKQNRTNWKKRNWRCIEMFHTCVQWTKWGKHENLWTDFIRIGVDNFNWFYHHKLIRMLILMVLKRSKINKVACKLLNTSDINFTFAHSLTGSDDQNVVVHHAQWPRVGYKWL